MEQPTISTPMSTPPPSHTVTQENQANNSADTPSLPRDTSSLPLRRKRGRPRKDDVPVSELSARTQQRRRANPPIISPSNSLVGQTVSGILDGTFDAGYLLTARVGIAGPVFRGVLFDPRLSPPISPENDIAPHLPMFRRDQSVSLPTAEASRWIGVWPPPMNEPAPFPTPDQSLQQNVAVVRPLPRNAFTLAPILAQPAWQNVRALQPRQSNEATAVSTPIQQAVKQNVRAVEPLQRNEPDVPSPVPNEAGPALRSESRPGDSEANDEVAAANADPSPSVAPQRSEDNTAQASVVKQEGNPVIIQASSHQTEKGTELAKGNEGPERIEGSPGNSPKILKVHVTVGGMPDSTIQISQSQSRTPLAKCKPEPDDSSTGRLNSSDPGSLQALVPQADPAILQVGKASPPGFGAKTPPSDAAP